MSTDKWIIDHDFQPFIGPPKPVACEAGWLSHQWTLSIDEGSIALVPRDHTCRLCIDGIAELEGEYLSGELPVELGLHVEHDYGGETEVWWELAAPSHIPGD